MIATLMAAALTLAPLGQALPAPKPAPKPTELEVVLLTPDGAPIDGAKLTFEGQTLGETDAGGSLLVEIPSGRGQLALEREGRTLLSLDLLTDDGEVILIIATVAPDREPEVVIESSSGSSILASEATESTTSEDEGPAAPPGALAGTITSAADNEPVPRAQVYFSGTDHRVESDKDGGFEAELPPGTYSVSIVHPRFSAQTLENIRVISGKQVTLNIALTPAGVRLQDYVVTAPYVEGSIASVIEQQRAASGVSDVLGADQIESTGDSNAAQALTRVTGLTVEDGKFVLVRGQPSRFTLALFNGSPLPSPEPLIRVVPLDLFPTGVLKGIEVQKSYSADKPGAFGAGLVQLNTRGVPDESFLKLSVSTGFNLQSVFQEGLTYEGGSTDWLGLDDGTRALPPEIQNATENGTVSLDDLPNEEKNELAKVFPNRLRSQARTLPPDVGIGVTAGTSVELPDDGRFGLVGTVGYDNEWRYQERIQRTYSLVTSTDELRLRNDLTEFRTDNDINVSGLLTAAVQWDDHELQSNTFIVNSTQQRTQATTGLEIGSDQLDIRRTLLSWIERFLLAQQLVGKHDFGLFQLEYRGLYSQARRDAPDRREYTYSRTPDQTEFFIRDPSGLTRNYSFVNDDQWSFGVDLATDAFAAEDWPVRIEPSVGLAYVRVRRDAGEQRFLWQPNLSAERSEPDPERIFDPAQTGATLNLRDNSILGSDDYRGSSDVLGYYLAADIEITDLFRLVVGARRESAEFSVETFQLSNDESDMISTGFDESDWLPAASLTWFALDELQVRAAYGKTLSRPVFNELSTSFFFDPDTGQAFQGNPNLVPTSIEGYDVRVEWYPTTTESATIGVFLKNYVDPLERTFVALGGGDQLATFQNADEALVRGLELGGRVELGRVRDWFGGPAWFESLYLSANVAVLSSEVTLSEQGIATSTNRPLDGQAEIVINAQAGYAGEAHDLTLAYNRVGTRLRRAGILSQPDIFQAPIDVLDLNYSWRLTKSAKLKLSATNLLNPETRLTQATESQEPQVFRQFTRGRSFGASFSYTF